MAPVKKEKEAETKVKLTPEQGAAAILQYLHKENRPYSATDISSNLHNAVTKTAAAKLLKDMHERQEIEGRASGKQIVYHVIQEEAPEDFLEKLAEQDREIQRLRDETVALKSEEKELRSSLRESAAQIPLPDLKANVEKLRKQKTELQTRLAKLRGGNVKPVSKVEKEKTERELARLRKVAINRKKIRLMLWNAVQDNSAKEKWEELKAEFELEF